MRTQEAGVRCSNEGLPSADPRRHEHTVLEGSLPGGVRRASRAAIYPAKLCHSILKGVAAQRMREGQTGPPESRGLGVCSLEEERPEMRERATLARRAAEDMEVGALQDLDDDLWSREWRRSSRRQPMVTCADGRRESECRL